MNARTLEFDLSAANQRLLNSLNRTEMFYESGVPFIYDGDGLQLKFSPAGIAKARALYQIEPEDETFITKSDVEMAVVATDSAFTVHAAFRIDGHLYTMPLNMLTLEDFR